MEIVKIQAHYLVALGLWEQWCMDNNVDRWAIRDGIVASSEFLEIPLEELEKKRNT